MTELRRIYPVLEAMQKAGLLLLVHGEATGSEIDLFDREAVFIDRHLIPLRRDFPELKIVFEHITTREAAQYVASGDAFTAATITPQHLLYNRNAIFTGGIRPHYYCLPVLKRETHRLALVEAATGAARVLPGHGQRAARRAPEGARDRLRGLLQRACRHGAVCRGLDGVGALDRLEGFASFHGPDFYGLPRNQGTLTLRRELWTPPESFPFGEALLKPLRSGEALAWRAVAGGAG